MSLESTAVWEKASALVGDRLGLHFPSDRLGDVRRGFTDAAAELGLGSGYACAQHFVGGRLESSQLDIVASHLTIGETYFFRGDETFAALERHVIPALLRARRGHQQRLRFWSAGCCTGEEAYSLAILLRQMLPDIEDWHITILATDLNPKFLRRAEAAVYGPWSFRGTSPELRERYFTRTPDGRFALVPRIREMVTFAPLNLVENVFPSLATGTNAMDLILCRNVLMYFGDAQAARAGLNLQASLAPDGWLAVAPCEVSRGLFPGLERVTREGAMLYRRHAGHRTEGDGLPPDMASRSTQGREGSSNGVVPSAMPRVPAVPSPPPPAAPRRPARGVRAVRPAVAVAPDAACVPDFARRARRAADAGRLEEALSWCDRWVAGSKLDAEAHYVHGVVLLENGAAVEARMALQRSAFLEPTAVMPSFALGNLERSLGRRSAAIVHYRHARELLEALGADDVVPYSEGIIATQLRALVRSLLATEDAE